MMVHFENRQPGWGMSVMDWQQGRFQSTTYKVWIDEKLIEGFSNYLHGASAKWLGIPSEERLNGFGVSAVCDGFSFAVKKWPSLGG